MMEDPKRNDVLNQAIQLMAKLPGVGPRTAFRFLQYLLDGRRDLLRSLGETLLTVADDVQECSSCHGWTGLNGQCDICQNTKRNHQQICVVASVQDQEAIERAGFFEGVYHILHGCLSPLDGIGPEELRIQSLLKRCQADAQPFELILATPSTVDGEATAMYLQQLCHPLNINLSRIASGVPVGDELHFVDRTTLAEAFKRRQRTES